MNPAGWCIRSNPYDFRRECQSSELLSVDPFLFDSKLLLLYESELLLVCSWPIRVSTSVIVTDPSSSPGLISSRYSDSLLNRLSFPRISFSDSAVKKLEADGGFPAVFAAEGRGDSDGGTGDSATLFRMLSSATKSMWLLRMAVLSRRPFSSSWRIFHTLTEFSGRSAGRVLVFGAVFLGN
uniref:(northern house mosquito) hypothetical protein n=1 Tax=Culex pipiens TaxID=7175 RepID=A0A8D8FH43_CULPI